MKDKGSYEKLLDGNYEDINLPVEKEIKELLTKRQIENVFFYTPYCWPRLKSPSIQNYDGIANYDFVCAARMLTFITRNHVQNKRQLPSLVWPHFGPIR